MISRFGPRKMSRALAAAITSAKVANSSSERDNNPLGAIALSPTALQVLTKPADQGRHIDPPPQYTDLNPAVNYDTSVPTTPVVGKTPQSPTTADISRNNTTNNNNNDTEESDKKKVLLVEDNSINMKLLIATLRRLSQPYACASNGLEAVTAYASSPSSFSLILMDISMPVMDGFTATELIRSLEDKNKWDRCTVMALTGVGDAEAKKRAFLAGVDDFMTKPVSMKKLGSIVNRLGDEKDNVDNVNNDNENENRHEQKQNMNKNNNSNNENWHQVEQTANQA
jgi:CheY-like chemotaxis protein